MKYELRQIRKVKNIPISMYAFPQFISMEPAYTILLTNLRYIKTKSVDARYTMF